MFFDRVVLVILLLLALWRCRGAHVAFAVLGLVYFPLNRGIRHESQIMRYTLREMAAFTVYHTSHHLTLVMQRAPASA